MERLALPELVSVTVCVLLLPTRTFPKARLVGLTNRLLKLKLVGLVFKRNVDPPALPPSATVPAAFRALLTSETLPVKLPVAAGAKATLKLLDWPTARVSGKVSPLRLNPAPLTVAEEMVRLAVPELVRVTV